MTDMIVRWADVRPGYQALNDGQLITIETIRVLPQDEGYPDFLVAYVLGTTEEGRQVAISPPAAMLTAVRRPAARVAPGDAPGASVALDYRQNYDKGWAEGRAKLVSDILGAYGPERKVDK